MCFYLTSPLILTMTIWSSYHHFQLIDKGTKRPKFIWLQILYSLLHHTVFFRDPQRCEVHPCDLGKSRPMIRDYQGKASPLVGAQKVTTCIIFPDCRGCSSLGSISLPVTILFGAPLDHISQCALWIEEISRLSRSHGLALQGIQIGKEVLELKICTMIWFLRFKMKYPLNQSI